MGLKVAVIYNRVPQGCSIDRASVEVERDGVVDACLRLGYDVAVFSVENLTELASLERDLFEFMPDCIFNLVEELDGDSQGEFTFANFLQRLGFPYTGCRPEAIFVGLHKHIAKMVLAYHGIPTPPFQLLTSIPQAVPVFGFPAILKLSSQDGSVGLSARNVVSNFDDYLECAAYMFDNYSQPILVEKFLPGREFVVAILGDEVRAVGEIAFPGEYRLVCYRSKWYEGSEEDINTPAYYPARVSADEYYSIAELGYRAFNAIGCTGYGRVDIREDDRGNLFVLEVNPNPDISPKGGFSLAVASVGLDYVQAIRMIIEVALKGS